MARSLVITLALLITVSASPLGAKAPTVRIVIANPDQTAPVEVIDGAVREFHIWAGPGVRINGVPQTEGFIAEWARGPIAEPSNELRRYRVAFYTACDTREMASCPTNGSRLSYMVMYVSDPVAGQGYVYLPGRGEPSYELNTRSIARDGMEGNWFLASRQWQRFVTPFISRSR